MKILVSFLTALLVMSSAAVAQSTRAVSGIVAMSTGPITVSYAADDGEVIGRTADIGDPIYLNDEISTGADTNLQILLKDQTLFTIGPDATIVFDEFVYDPASGAEPALSATVKKGVFKFISGKVSANNPEAMKLNLPNATASIRGTTVAGRVKPNGESEVVLLSGAIAVSSDTNPDPVDIFQSGWGTSISSTGIIEEPFVMPAEILSDILSEASVTAVVAALTQNDPEGEGEGEGEGEPVLSPQQEAIAEFAEFATAELVEEGQEEVSFGDVVSLLLANDDLRAILEAQGLDPDNAPDINYAYLDVQLISMLASGASPEYMRLQDDGDGTHSISHVGSSDYINGLVSGSYAGSVHFASSGLELAHRGNATSAGGTVSYDYSVSYDTARAVGSFSVDNLQIDSVTYGSNSASFNTLLHNISQAGFEGDEDMVLSVGDEVFEVQTSSMSISNGSDTATVEMSISLGSISDGTTTIDGLLGGTNIMAYDNNDGELRARAEKYEVGRTK